VISPALGLEALLAAVQILRDQGPTLGRPLVDTVKGSRHSNMKELRPGSTGRTEIRVLFAFDIERQAILLVGGDKSDDWKGLVPDEHPDRRRSVRRAPGRTGGTTGEDRARAAAIQGYEGEKGEETMSLNEWEKKVLETSGAAERVREIEDELRLATALTTLREQAGISQRELAGRLGVSQPRIAAIERSRNVTIDVLENYVDALGAKLDVSVVQGRRRTPLLSARAKKPAATKERQSQAAPTRSSRQTPKRRSA
jgi:transcriptional regulator with XRE-family HTH domain